MDQTNILVTICFILIGACLVLIVKNSQQVQEFKESNHCQLIHEKQNIYMHNGKFPMFIPGSKTYVCDGGITINL